MEFKIVKKDVIDIYEDLKGKKMLNSRQFQQITGIEARYSDFIKRKIRKLVENVDYYKKNTKEYYGDNLFRNICEYYITIEAAKKLCFLSQNATCKRLQEEILKNKEKSFLEILEKEINQIMQEKRVEEIKKITIEDKEYPESLKKIKNPPQKLYIKGDKELLKQNGIAVIGSRTTSNYGKKMCKIFVNNLVGYNLNIISGLAKGMDAAAHKNCIEAKGKTIAVLPCGLKHIYPKKNADLYKKILEEGGLIVSEYELDEKENSEHFRERNRIVAGLSIGTLVIESHRKSGTSITVRNTEEQNKKSFCIPSSLENSKGAGNNEMIRDKRAKLVMTVEDIIEEYPELQLKKKEDFEFLEINNKKIIKKEKQDEKVSISNENLEIYNAIIEGAETIEEIMQKTNKDSKEVAYKLTMLELENAIESLPGKRYKIKNR
ncbi:MAG: DNA-protecting protein DprA [Clostridia bacterium]|nr:DNA-protecting protein DprA [Clostridia bacterium]